MQTSRSVWILCAAVLVVQGQPGGPSLEGQHASPANSSLGVSLLTAANQEFAFRLYRSLAAQPVSRGNNIFFSPLSVSVALAALAVGARGETHRQLFKGLGLDNTSLSQTHVDLAFQSLFQETRKASSEVSSGGTAVFVDRLFKAQPDFLHTLKTSYFADGFSVDFTKSSESANTINQYVEEKTSGKINKLVEDLDPNTVMYLISYIHFKGKTRPRRVCRSSAVTSVAQQKLLARLQRAATILELIKGRVCTRPGGGAGEPHQEVLRLNPKLFPSVVKQANGPVPLTRIRPRRTGSWWTRGPRFEAGKLLQHPQLQTVKAFKMKLSISRCQFR